MVRPRLLALAAPAWALLAACSSEGRAPAPSVARAAPSPTVPPVLTPAAPGLAPVVDPARRAAVAEAIALARRAEPAAELTKADVRAPLKQFIPMLGDCYDLALAAEPGIGGVVNTELVVDADPERGTILDVRGFDTAGPLGRSRAFRDCVTETAASVVLPAIGRAGTLKILYPITFAPRPPDNHDTSLVERAEAAFAAGRWEEALDAAERGLEQTSLDGPIRRRLIGIAGVSACRTRREERARHYFALASAPVYDAMIREACARDGVVDLGR